MIRLSVKIFLAYGAKFYGSHFLHPIQKRRKERATTQLSSGNSSSIWWIFSSLSSHFENKSYWIKGLPLSNVKSSVINLQELQFFLRKVMRSNIALMFFWTNINLMPLSSGWECPNSLWTKYSGACYFKPGGAWSYHEQLANCTGFGASLISIHNHNENSFISALAWDYGAYLPYFIGLKRENCEAEWKWADGTTLDFTCWNKCKHQND